MAARFYNFLSADSDSSCTLLGLVESHYFTLVMLAVVLSNTVVMIFETYDSFYDEHLSFFIVAERIYLTIYIVECGLKLWVSLRILEPMDMKEGRTHLRVCLLGLFLEVLQESLELLRLADYWH